MIRAVLLAALAVSMVVSTSTAAAEPDTTTIDADHGLTDAEEIDAFESDGVATASLEVPDMRLGVSETYDDGDLGAGIASPAYTYFQINYNESLERTLQIWIPADYWYPSPQSIQAIEQPTVEASFRPIRGSRYTQVTVTLSEPGTYTFAVPQAAGVVFEARSKTRTWIENVTGEDLPTLMSSTNWQRIEPNELTSSTNRTYPPIESETEPTIQYRSGSDRWLPVTDCGSIAVGDSAPVCEYRSGNYTVVRTRGDVGDPPTLRYKRDAGLIPDPGSVIAGVRETVDRILNDLFGGDSDG